MINITKVVVTFHKTSGNKSQTRDTASIQINTRLAIDSDTWPPGRHTACLSPRFCGLLKPLCLPKLMILILFVHLGYLCFFDISSTFKHYIVVLLLQTYILIHFRQPQYRSFPASNSQRVAVYITLYITVLRYASILHSVNTLA